MSAQEYSLLSQTERRSMAFLKEVSIDLSSKLSLKQGGNVNYYKRVHHSLSTLPLGIGNTQVIFKTNR